MNSWIVTIGDAQVAADLPPDASPHQVARSTLAFLDGERGLRVAVRVQVRRPDGRGVEFLVERRIQYEPLPARGVPLADPVTGGGAPCRD